ncbi:MAG TPA: MmcQ/YjbR family DNA-binding protein [Vicinamibacterales bacterium]
MKVRGKTFVGFDRVRRIGLAMADVEESLAWGVPALRAGGRVICCTAAHKDAEPNTLVVMMSFDRRDALIEEEPDVYYLKPHYVGYPSVLVRLARVRDDALRDLLLGAQRFVSNSGKRKPLKPRGRRPTRRRS